MKQKILYLLLSFCLLSSCKDDLMYNPSDFREGNSDVTFCMSFHPETNVSLGGTRAANGDAIQEIKNLFIILYDLDGNYTGLHYYFENPNTTYVDRDENCPVDTMPTTETKTMQAKVECRIPYGTYHIYAVANMGDLTKSEYYGSIAKEADFKAIRFKWNTDTAKIQQNCQMSGYFTTNNTEYIRDGKGNYQRNAENLVIDKDVTSLHAWLRRAVSKVTVAYDATNLREGIYIYLKSVKLKNIPASCSLVDENKPEGKDINVQGEKIMDLIENGDTIIYETREETTSDTAYILTKGHPHIKEHEKIHNNDARAMFFYENMQGIGEVGTPTDKRQNAGKGNTIAYPDGAEKEDKDKNKDSQGEGWRDGMVNGTYVEVEAYYVSNAVGNVGRGRIIYRFMLGKDIITDYNAERNYHYKLTMKFNGNANDVDWHIDYKEEDSPGAYVPDYYVSYLYNQPYIDYESDNSPGKTSYWEKCYPLRLTGSNIGKEVEIRIIENNWYPTGEDDELQTADVYYWKDEDNPTGNNWETYKKASKEERAKMMIDAVKTYDNSRNNYQTPNNSPRLSSSLSRSGIWHGFLSLYPQEGQAQIPSDNWERFSAGEYIYWYSRGQNPIALKGKAPLEQTEETGYGEGFRTYKTTLTDSDPDQEVGEKIYFYMDSNNKKSYYKVVKSIRNGMHETMLYIPLYTRPLIINQKKGFTGNNPYFSFQRAATIQVNTQINGEEIERTATVRQVRRIINPKGIFRSWDNTTPFKVTLMNRTSEQAGEDFKAFPSEDGPWRATIVAGKGWTISGSEGSTNSLISFTVAPEKKLADETKTACALVRVEYHNYHCVHYIHLRQGYAPLTLDDDEDEEGEHTYWHSFNVEYTDDAKAYECDTELEGGSMFRYGNLTQPIDGINNDFDYKFTTTAKFNGQFVLAPVGQSKRADDDQFATWDDITPVSSGFAKTEFTVDGVPSRMATYADFKVMKTNKDLDFSLGLCYGDEATENTTDDEKAFYYSWFARKGAPDWLTKIYTPARTGTDPKGISGVRGCFVYNHKNAKVIFLSLGACSYGRRKGRLEGKTDGTPGILRYGDFDLTFNAQYNSQAPYVPQLHALNKNYGAIYWVSDRIGIPDGTVVAWDINYGGIDFNSIYTHNLHTDKNSKGELHADAAYIRLVQDTKPTLEQCKKIDERMKAYQK